MKTKRFCKKVFLAKSMLLFVMVISFFAFSGIVSANVCGSANGATFVGNPPVNAGNPSVALTACSGGASVSGFVHANSNGTWDWWCVAGVNGQISDHCVANAPSMGPTAGACGSASSATPTTSAPSAVNLCAYGSYLNPNVGLGSSQATAYCSGASQNDQSACEDDGGTWVLYAPGTGPISWSWGCVDSISQFNVGCGAIQLVGNGCAANTCSTITCWNSLAWVQGTKNCAANGVCGSSNGQTLPSAPATNLCGDGSLPAVSGTGPWTWTCLGSSGGSNAPCSANKTPDNSCAAITCGLPAPAQICWNGSAFVSGTKDCRVSNGCEANICSSKICFNGIIWATGTKPQSYSNQTCNTIQTLDCSLQSNCGKTNTVTKACIGTDNCTGDNNASIPGQCGAGCDSTVSVSCPACPNQATTGTWTEVQP